MSKFYTQEQLKIIADNIKWYRHKSGLRQTDLAKASNIHYRYYQDIEAGKRNITIESLTRIAKSLELSPSDLVSLKRIHINTNLDNFISLNRETLNKSSLPIGIRDKDLKVTFCNPLYLEFFQGKEEDFLNKELTDIFNGNSHSYFGSMVKVEATGESTTHFITITKKGSDQKFSLKASPVCIYHQGKYIGAVVAIQPFDKKADSLLDHFYVMLLSLKLS